MKHLLMIAASVIALSANAQKIKESEVPAPVKDAFSKAYPAAKEVKWEKEAADYEAEFKTAGKEQSVLFDSKGSLLETEAEIALTELPAAVNEYISKNYKGTKIKEASKITDVKGVVTYEAEVKGKDLIFDSTGKFVKEVKE